nr:integrase, catalytic region, zinc finger, CCHC-type, peptidase aspartic, catalytic [Tanacetum cinerariifolium]
MEAGGKDRPPMLALDKDVPVAEGSTETTTERYMENYKNVSQDIRDQLNAEAEAVRIILTGIDNDIYSTVDACPNACETWKAIERLKQGESINVQDLETNLYWKFGKFTSRDGESLKSYSSRFYKMMNELVRNQCDVTNHQVNIQFLLQLQPEWQRGKAVVNSPPTIYDQEPSMVADDDEMSKDKEINKLMALISLSFKKIYKPTNNNLRTSSNTSRANQNNSLRISRGTRYDNQRIGNVAGAKETVEVNQDAADDSGPIFDTKPLQKVSNNDNYNVFVIESEHPEQSKFVHNTYPIEQDEHNVIIDSLDMSYDTKQIDHDDDDDLANERDLLASLIEKLKCEIDDSKNRNKFLETSNKALVDKLKEQKEAQLKFYKTREDKEIDKVIVLANKNKVLDNIVYKIDQIVQTMNMLNRNCKTNFAKPEFLKQAQRANPHLYDIGCYNDNIALMLAPESEEVIRLEKESRSKLSDLIRHFDYEKLNNLYDLFVPQRENSSTQRYFSEMSKMRYIPGVIPTTSVSRPQLKSNQIKDRVMLNNSQGKKHEVEDRCRNVKFSKNKMSVTACNDSLNAKTSNVNFVCATCGKSVPISTREPKLIVNQSVAKPLRRIVASEYTNQKLRHTTRKLYEHLVEIILFIVDSGCSKYMTGNLKLLINFVEKFPSTVKFENDQIATILGYGDLVQGAVTIKRVYYVEGLNHNLFSVGQFCDADLDVAFRKSTCYICDLKGNDLLTGSRGTYLYSITLQDISSPNPICLMAKATSSQAWLWHRRLSHLNFDTVRNKK